MILFFLEAQLSQVSQTQTQVLSTQSDVEVYIHIFLIMLLFLKLHNNSVIFLFRLTFQKPGRAHCLVRCLAG